MAYAVVAGHNSIIPGAAGNGYKEHEVARQIKDKVIFYLKQLGEKAFDCTDNVGRTKEQVWKNAVANCNKAIGKNGFIIAIHLNAGGGTGTEVFDYKGRQKDKCQRISARLAKDFSWNNRGWKNGDWIGLIKTTQAPVVYVEVCFIDNKNDMQKLMADIDKAAIGIVEEMTNKKVSHPKKEEKKATSNQPGKFALEAWEKAQTKKSKDGTSILDGTRPQEPITREQFAVVLDRLGLLD
ncbi:N-acetylmuramoyl-L-alanine amidase [Robertmurraya sp. DFI.2.37]|uniref:N-acetylmuramoyl-L-alanine amidase n=1 Tax=Robertmurraya sp. DFI.2.37 TaxID=3031819 RepID=UPI0012460F6F|nr:N-acetylmuramoyl-L-alanine amidase [Robertmurraya sp. DFI.2.37]MDF1507613.1 N-acetylmuramoyl-L-alanine amidase [Robertmurraya sp. DFI.2.37]